MGKRATKASGRAKDESPTGAGAAERGAAVQAAGEVMTRRLEVRALPGRGDGRGPAALQAALGAGVSGLERVDVVVIYWLRGQGLGGDAAGWVGLCADPILQRAAMVERPTPQGDAFIEVARRPGVTDAVAESLLAMARRLGLPGLDAAASGVRYELHRRKGAAPLDLEAVRRLAATRLANAVVDRWVVGAGADSANGADGASAAGGDAPLSPAFLAPLPTPGALQTVPMRALDGAGLLALSAERRMALDLPEMTAIAAHFRAEGRDPTDLELEMIAQTWSEHCVHKTFKAIVEQRELDAEGKLLRHETIDSLFKTYIVAATRAAPDQERLRSVFVDNAGIVAFDDGFDLALKVETHNHPSALEPFGGANTGVGGVIRDILGVSARPIANLDVLCFGPPDSAADALPAGVLHPARIRDGVVDGIEDYGNKMGVPTVGGAIVYDPGYIANPLVFCGTLGLLPTGSHRCAAEPGDLCVVLGGRTGRDGLRGATFSSMAMGEETAAIASTSVQIGHPIHAKAAQDVVLAARDALAADGTTRGLYTAITDCGAGGLSSAIGEMAKDIGAAIDLTAVPLKVAGLAPWEAWLSEAQERMVLAIPEANWPAFAQLCADFGAEAAVLGRFRGDGRLLVSHGEATVADLDTAFLHGGIPQRTLQGYWQAPVAETLPPCPAELTAALLALLRSPGIRSKEDVVRRYDHLVQGGTRQGPLVGARDHAPSDAAVLVPQRAEAAAAPVGRQRGVALAVGLCPRVGLLDPYAMAWMAVDEAIRNAVAVGADPDQIALLDNFCWGSPTLPDRLGAMTRCARGCHDAAVAFGAPFISGKDSLHNEYRDAAGVQRAIPGTLLITALGILNDVATMVCTAGAIAGDRLYLIGACDDALGGAAYLGLAPLHGVGLLGDRAPLPVPEALEAYRQLHGAISDGLCRAVHDVSEGGLAVTLAELAIACGLGLDADLDLCRVYTPATAASDADAEATTMAAAIDGDEGSRSQAKRADARLFGERGGRLVVAVKPAHVASFELAMSGVPCARIGAMRADDRFGLRAAGASQVSCRVAGLEAAFRGHIAAPSRG